MKYKECFSIFTQFFDFSSIFPQIFLIFCNFFLRRRMMPFQKSVRLEIVWGGGSPCNNCYNSYNDNLQLKACIEQLGHEEI